jgi:hypothetical protein
MILLSINAQKKEPQAKVAPGLSCGKLFSAPGF